MPQRDSGIDSTTEREWTAGSYQVLARAFMPMAARLVDETHVGTGDRVLDVACGSGNVAITAHRRGGDVTGLDITPAMLDLARAEAAVIDAAIDWELGDAADLPFADDSFDVTLSSVGHIFAPNPDTVAQELARVTVSGGRIGYTVWTPQSAIAAVMQAFDPYLPDAADEPVPPIAWSDLDIADERFGDAISALDATTATVRYPALSPAHFWDSLRTHSGATIVALERVPVADHDDLEADIVNALEPFFDDATNSVPLEYRLVTATLD